MVLVRKCRPCTCGADLEPDWTLRRPGELRLVPSGWACARKTLESIVQCNCIGGRGVPGAQCTVVLWLDRPTTVGRSSKRLPRARQFVRLQHSFTADCLSGEDQPWSSRLHRFFPRQV
ncbi:unnamed protein product [Symbiodinium sp. CCMP2456]|nr:unnamed protein product [Symbiodinium sp. CCMP2456]